MIKIDKITKVTPSDPTQWFAETDNDKIMFFQYKFGRLSYGLGKTKKDAIKTSENCGMLIGGETESKLSYEDLVSYLGHRFSFHEKETLGLKKEKLSSDGEDK